MSSDKHCCVSVCKDSGGMHAVLHGFPNPEKDRICLNLQSQLKIPYHQLIPSTSTAPESHHQLKYTFTSIVENTIQKENIDPETVICEKVPPSTSPTAEQNLVRKISVRTHELSRAEKDLKDKGRRFTLQEKIAALSVFKQSPKTYRFLRKIFILPANQTLAKLIQKCNLRPGLNKNIFSQLKKKTEKVKISLLQENPDYKGIRLIPKLTEYHVNPDKLNKMKATFASQVFSRTVASNKGYLADKGILPAECKETADLLLFMDNVFDFVNGKNKKYAKPLLGPATPTSAHKKTWVEAKSIINSMEFLTSAGRVKTVPTLKNWVWKCVFAYYWKRTLVFVPVHVCK